MYHIIHSSVDGAGTQDRKFTTLADAITEADRQQSDVDSNGNTLGYRYSVWSDRDFDSPSYRTHPRETTTHHGLTI